MEQRIKWQELILYDKDTETIFWPSAPANQYLQKEDLEVFKNITGKRFLSHYWKGTVLGIATDNYPACTKAGTITINKDLFRSFISSNCYEKTQIALTNDLDYVYSASMKCPDFNLVSKGAENFYLYKFDGTEY